MTSKERVLAAIEGRPVDRFPVAAPYLQLLQEDHWCELTGRPAWTYYDWMLQEPAEHVKEYGLYLEQLPFDLLTPQHAMPRERRLSLEVVEDGGAHYYHDRRTGERQLLNEDLHQMHGGPNVRRTVFSKEDVDAQVRVTPAGEQLASGRYDYIREAARLYGRDHFVITGVVNTFYQCTAYLGETNLFAMLHDDPALIEYLSERILARIVEDVRALAAAGSDAIWIDDALSTCELISLPFYERFCRPYVKALVDEIHAQGKKAVLVYFGGIADRVRPVAGIGADSLQFEASMKGYVNDLGEIAAQAGEGICLWGNLDPLADVQEASPEAMRQAMARQVAVGRRSGRFIISTGSPITPLTPLQRIRRYIETGWELGDSREQLR